MIYREYPCSSPAVAAIWSVDVPSGAPANLPYRVLPDGCLDLVFRYRSSRYGLSDAELLVAGPTQSADVFGVQPNDRFIGIRFRPGWGSACLRVDAADLTHRLVPAVDVSSGLRQLAERMAVSATGDIARGILDRAACGWTDANAGDSAIRHAAALIKASGGRMATKDLASAIGTSTRGLRRRFHTAVGLSPKTLGRITRFQSTLSLIRTHRMSLAAAACAGGYADQAHMTREFVDLGGLPPRALVAA